MAEKKVNPEIALPKEEHPDHIPIVPIDQKREKGKQEARKLAEEIRKKTGNIEPIIITDSGVKKASELTYAERELEFVKCASNPIYFIETYLTIFDQTQGEAGEIVRFKLFDYQKDLIQTYLDNRFVVANKYRQAGISTTTCAYISWYVMFNQNRQVAIVADKLETARDELMSDVVEFINGCPSWLRPKTGRETETQLKDTQKLKLYDNGSRLGAFSSKGLRGMTPTLIFWDETAWTEKGDKFWTSAQPTLQTGGAAIMVSTPSGLDPVFYKTFDSARKGKSTFKAVELWWFNDPRYNKDLVWLKNKDKTNEIRLIDENWDIKRRIQLMDDGWEASSPWFEEQIMNANGDMRKIAQELLCVFGDATITVRNKNTGLIETLRIEDLYNRLYEQKNSCTYLYVNKYMKRRLINKIIGINIEKYRIKGGVSMFNKEYPNLIDEINQHTVEMQTCSMNKTLYAKLLYLKKYNGIIEDITDSNNKVMVFNREIGDFTSKAINSAKKSWEITFNDLNTISGFYSKEETIFQLKDIYQNYLGKSGNRKLMKDNLKLFVSLYHHTSHMDLLNKNLNKFSHRLYILINNIDIYCDIHSTLKHWKFINGKFSIVCGKCEPKYPSIDWFKKTYNDEWKIHYNKRVQDTKLNQTNSLKWFMRKYGENGKEMYKQSVSDRMKRIVELKGNRYSKISQDLFWSIYKKLTNKENTYFYQLNSEFVIKIPESFNYVNTVMIVDFKYGNKIIEYNGQYWHNTEKDKIRYNILKKMGYDVLVVTSDEFNRNKKPKEIINKCLNFLQC